MSTDFPPRPARRPQRWLRGTLAVLTVVSLTVGLAPAAQAGARRKAPPTQVNTPVAVSTVGTTQPVPDPPVSSAPARVAAPVPASSVLAHHGGVTPDAADTTVVGGSR